MAKALRKIELMHRQFGVIEGKTCGQCSNLTEHRYDKLYRKCKIYGETSSEASDWAKSWTACGLFGKEYSGAQMIRIVTRGKCNKQAELPGQIGLEVGNG